MSDDKRVDELLSALQMTSPRRGFAERTMLAFAAAEQTRRLKNMVWSLVGATGLSMVTTLVVLLSGVLKTTDLTGSVALFAMHSMKVIRLATGAVHAAPMLAVVLLISMITCCALTTLLLERSVRARA